MDLKQAISAEPETMDLRQVISAEPETAVERFMLIGGFPVIRRWLRP